MATIFRNVCNVRANESLVIAQKDGTFLEGHCSTLKDESDQKRVWPNLYEWKESLRRNGKLGSIIVYTDWSHSSLDIDRYR
jgi:hypothetical protein